MEEIRRLQGENEIAMALELTRKVFTRFVAPKYPAEGCETFFKVTEIAENVRRTESGEYVFYGAFDGERIVGTAASRMCGSHVMLLFVDEQYQRRGIARALMARLIADAPGEVLTVNAAPGAHEAYLGMGFVDTAPEQTESGMRFTPMEYRKI